MAAYSMDLRAQILAGCDAGIAPKQVSPYVCVSSTARHRRGRQPAESLLVAAELTHRMDRFPGAPHCMMAPAGDELLKGHNRATWTRNVQRIPAVGRSPLAIGLAALSPFRCDRVYGASAAHSAPSATTLVDRPKANLGVPINGCLRGRLRAWGTNC